MDDSMGDVRFISQRFTNHLEDQVKLANKKMGVLNWEKTLFYVKIDYFIYIISLYKITEIFKQNLKKLKSMKSLKRFYS